MIETLQDLVGLTYEVDVDDDDIEKLAGTDNLRIYSNQMIVDCQHDMTRLNVRYDHETKEILTVDYG